MPMPALRDRTFRAGNAYDLVAFERLAPEEQLLLADLRADRTFYGILRPRDGGARSMRSVDRDTALLWYGAQVPGRLPAFVWETAAEAVEVEQRIVQLVLDGVLDIAVDDAFLSGAAALASLSLSGSTQATGQLHRRSLDALHHAARAAAARVARSDTDELAAMLYQFGAVPLTPAWEQRLPDADAVLQFLGAAPGTTVARRLQQHFTRLKADDSPAWIAWSGNSRRPHGAGAPSHKLYVSPIVEDLPRAFAIVTDILPRHHVLQFKVGASAHGLLRPDKLVVYLDREESLQALAAELSDALGGLRAHGVPFSAEISHDGLLSWGMDPPAEARTLQWMPRDSWRLWVVRRLAAKLVAARAEVPVAYGDQTDHDDTETLAVQYALARLRLDGVDVEQWTPNNRHWWAA